jgi:photosystem II stability/assembly factor-like uncharacterized protein
MSSDGSTIAACVSPGYILTSHDSGTTWTVQTGAGNNTWATIAVSSDGTKMVAGYSGFNSATMSYIGSIYSSVDGGATWTLCSGVGSGSWSHVTMSGTGSVIAACNNQNENLYVSKDSGSTWAALTAPSGYYFGTSFVSSSDGSIIASFANMYGSFTISKNYGSTWSDATRSTGGGSNLLMSSDGSKIVFFSGNTMYSYNGN